MEVAARNARSRETSRKRSAIEWTEGQTVDRLAALDCPLPSVLRHDDVPHWVPWTPPPTLTETQQAELATSIAAAKRDIAPAGEEGVAVVLMRMAAVLSVTDDAAVDTKVDIYTEELRGYPVDLLEGYARERWRTSPFFPDLCDILKALRDPMHQRKARLQRLLVMQCAVLTPPHDGTVNYDQLRAWEHRAKGECERLVTVT